MNSGGIGAARPWGRTSQPRARNNGTGATANLPHAANNAPSLNDRKAPSSIISSSMQTLSLRQWIQHQHSPPAINNGANSNSRSATLSPQYMKACLQIALPLTEQIIQAEKLADSYGIHDKLAVLPIRNGIEWARYTTVTLREEQREHEGGKCNVAKAKHAKNDGEQKDFCVVTTADLETKNYHVSNNFNQQNRSSESLNGPNKSDAPNEKIDDDDCKSDQEVCCHSQEVITFDWESGAMVGMNEYDANANANAEESSNNLLQELQLDSCEVSISNHSLHGDEKDEVIDQDLNEQFEVFPSKISADDFEIGEDTNRGGESKTTSNSKGRQEVMTPTNSRPESHSQRKVTTNLINIDSAQIKCPEGSFRNYASSDDNSSTEKLQRIFHLALLFYELFSGGEAPNSNICALATSGGAFVSLPTLTLAEEMETDETIFSEPKRRQGPDGSGRKMSLCKLSFERLKFIGVPGPICHLVFNMLDSVYGDLSGEECYKDIGDVKFDLELMLRKPRFLNGLDLNELSVSSCLQFNHDLISREEELQLIRSSYERCQSGSSEVAIIKGESGSGKTWLAHRVGNFVIANGGLFLIGKFDQLQQGRPFSALVSAFDKYCDILMSQKETDWACAVVRNLNEAFGQDISHLIKVIPKLGQIMGDNDNTLASSDHDSDAGNIMERIKYLLCQFVEIINANSIAPITLFLDDLQWADEASTAVIARLVMTQARKRFYFLGCYRDDENESNNVCSLAMEAIRTHGINTRIIHTKCLTEDALNTVISDLLGLSPRVVKSLSSIVHNRTKGNILFISQLLLSLSRDGLLRIDLGSQRWVWDLDKIYSANLPDNVAICFADGIKKLSTEVQLALHTLSMFGSRTKSDCIKLLESELNVKIIEPLKKAVAEGLVKETEGSFQFCHDRIQEASYQIIQEHDRLFNHFTYGRRLVQRALEICDDEMLFTAVNQINFGGPSAVADRSEYYIMANYNLTAARKAMTMSDFHTAYSFCDNGITFLRSDHWTTHYEFSLELFDIASKCALATGNTQSLRILSENVFKHARCFEHKLNVYFCIISSQALTSKAPEALDRGLDVVSQLGETIPRRPSQFMLDQQMEQTLAITRGMTRENLLNYRIMEDVQKLAAMRILIKLQGAAFFVNHILHSYIVLKMVQITISCGELLIVFMIRITHTT